MSLVGAVRGQVLAVREEDYVQGARAVGASDLRIFWRYILPNSFAPLLVQATVNIGAVNDHIHGCFRATE